MLGRGFVEYDEPSFFWYTVFMNIEVLYSPYEEALNTGLLLCEEHKILPESMWLAHIKRETKRKNLFVYRHAYTDKYVLAHWIFPPWEVDKPICLELDTMDKAPDRGGWIPTQEVKFRCKAIDPEQKIIEKQLRVVNQAKRKEREEQLGRRNEQVANLRRKGKHKEASILDHSKVHYSDEDSELKESLRNITKNKTITHG